MRSEEQVETQTAALVATVATHVLPEKEHGLEAARVALAKPPQ